MRKPYRPVAMFIAMFILTLHVSVGAQSFWLERNHGKVLGLEIFKPGLGGGLSDYLFKRRSTFFLSQRAPIGSKTFLMAELPFSHFAFDTKSNHDSSLFRGRGAENRFGNPYLGVEIGGIDAKIFTEIGIRLPLNGDIGAAIDLDRDEAFDDYAAVKALLNYQRRRDQGFTYHFRGGPVVLLDFNNPRDNYFVFLVDALIRRETKRMSFGAGVIMRISLYEYRYSTINQRQNLVIVGGLKLGNLRPSVYIRFQDSEYADLWNAFALNLGIQL